MGNTIQYFDMNIRKVFVTLGDLFYYKILEKELLGMDTVLDVGCGADSPLAQVKKTFYSVGVDIFEPSIKKSKKKKIHDDYKIGDILNLSKFVKKKSFDGVVALDIIEHLEKKDGYTLLKQMELIAKKRVIVLTPYGFTQQHPYDENPYQIHKSGWYDEDFKKLGYTVYGMRGFRFIRGECATIKYKPWFFWGILAVLSQFVVYKYPSAGYQLLAVKNIR